MASTAYSNLESYPELYRCNTGYILIVDDDPSIAEVLDTFLSDEGYEVHCAENGICALQEIAAEKPSIILLDLMMPFSDGLDVVRAMSQCNEWRNIPIIVFSASLDVAYKASKMGVNGWLSKPFDLDDVLDVVRRHIASEKQASDKLEVH